MFQDLPVRRKGKPMKEAESTRPKITEAEFLKLIGDPAELVRNMETFNRSCDAFDAQYKDLHAKYPDRWVAFYNGVLIATTESLDSVIERLKGAGIPTGHSYVRFIARHPKTIIL